MRYTVYKLFDEGWRHVTSDLRRIKKTKYEDFPENHRNVLNLAAMMWDLDGVELRQFELEAGETVGAQFLMYPYLKEVWIEK